MFIYMNRKKILWQSPHSIVVNVPDCDIILSKLKLWSHYYVHFHEGGAHGVMVIIIGNGLGDTSSNPGQD